MSFRRNLSLNSCSAFELRWKSTNFLFFWKLDCVFVSLHGHESLFWMMSRSFSTNLQREEKKKTNTKNGSLPTPNILVDWDKLCLRIRLTVVITLDNIIGWSIIFYTFKCIIVPLFFYLSLPIWEYSLVAFSILFKCTCVVCVIGK